MLFNLFDVLRFFEALQIFPLKHLLTLSWRKPLSYRNQSIDLRRKSGFYMDLVLRTGFYILTVSVMKELKWGKNEEKYWIQHILWSSKILFCFWINTCVVFFSNGHIRNVVSMLPNIVKIDVENNNIVSTLPTLFSSTLKNTTLFYVVNFNVDIHNVDLTLCNVATSYQPENVEPTLKCLLGSVRKMWKFRRFYIFSLNLKISFIISGECPFSYL